MRTKITVSVDPGVRGLGVAVFANEVLLAAEYVKNPDKQVDVVRNAEVLAREAFTRVFGEGEYGLARGLSGYWVEIVLERDKVYRSFKQRGDPNDLLALMAINGALAGYFAAKLGSLSVVSYLPSEWKHQLDKDKTETRVRERLTPEELGEVREHGALSNNVWDSVGIGLFHLGRFQPVRIIARG